MPDDLTESERRALAYEHRGEVTDDPAEIVEPRRVPQMVSLRMDGDVLATLRDIANERGLSLSDLLREGADCVINGWVGHQRLAHVRYVSSMTGRSFSGAYDVVVHAAVGTMHSASEAQNSRDNYEIPA